MLFDSSKKLLDSRFLKHDEDIRTGESVALDAHLVDVGDPEVKHENKNLNAQGNSYSSVSKVGAANRQLNFLMAKKPSVNGQCSVMIFTSFSSIFLIHYLGCLPRLCASVLFFSLLGAYPCFH